MGVCGSTGSTVSDEDRLEEKIRRSSDLFDMIINAKSPHIRLDTADDMKRFHIQGQAYSFDINYCYVSQRGYYPNGKLLIFSMCGYCY
jgi:hypothetical protein